jgi:thermostable 8-oxoguanine DNA glycosylase
MTESNVTEGNEQVEEVKGITQTVAFVERIKQLVAANADKYICPGEVADNMSFIKQVESVAKSMAEKEAADKAKKPRRKRGKNNDASITTSDIPLDDEEIGATDEEEVNTEITDFHPGTVDNPFLYNGTPLQLDKFLLTCIFVAGKNAAVQQKKVDAFVECVRRDLGNYTVDGLGILSAIHNSFASSTAVNDAINGWLQEVKAGQYSRITKCIHNLSERVGAGKLKLKDTARSSLYRIPGIGLKTASFFMMYTDKNAKDKYACLDTHILKWLNVNYPNESIPDRTPSKPSEYARLENLFLAACKERNKTPSALDFEIWSEYRQKPSVGSTASELTPLSTTVAPTDSPVSETPIEVGVPVPA